MALRSINTQRTRLADQVYDQLLEAILNEEIGPDDRLVQEKLAAELQISRTPVREALLRLEQDGVLVNAPRGGFMLYKMTEGEVKELYQARAAIEGQAARILASQNDPQKNILLRQTILREEQIKEPSVRAYFDANRKIHRAFVELVDNRHLLDMFDNIWNRAVAYQIFAAIDNVDISKSLGDHLALVEAIETGDKAHVLEVFIDHINDGFNLQIEGLFSERS